MRSAILCFVLVAMLQTAQAFADSDVTSPVHRKLIVGVVEDPPYIFKNKNGEWTGLSVDTWKAVAARIEASYEFREMELAALLDSLQENSSIDLSIEVFFLLAEREEQIDFSVPLGSSRLAVATLPDRIDHPWVTAIKIFFSWGTMKVLFLLLLTLCFLGFLLWLIERDQNPEQFGGGKVKGIGSGVYWAGSTLASGVCFGISLKSLAARGIGLLWMLVCALALSALTASLTTSLTESKAMTSMVSEEMLRHMKLASVKGSAEATVLEGIGGRATLYRTEEDALNAVIRKEVDGYVHDELTLRYYSENDFQGKISIYPTELRRFSFAYGLPKDSPLRKKINAALLRFMEKPDWVYLLNRYGLGQNLEEIPSSYPRRRPK